MTNAKKETKCDDLIDALLEEHGISQEAVLGENGLIAQLKKRVVERALAGELTHHLGYAKGEAPEEIDNHRNGYSKKTVVGEDGAMEIEVPRDRSGSFEPLLIAKGQKRFEGFDEKIIAMYARGMTVREIPSLQGGSKRRLHQHGDRFGIGSRGRVAESASGAQLSSDLFRCAPGEDPR
jgi:putative transposase